MIKKSSYYLSLCIKNYLLSYSGLQLSVWIGIFFNFLNSIVMGILPFLPLYFVNILKFESSNAGILIAFYGIGTLFGGLVGGKLSDKFCSQKLSGQFLLLQSIAYVLLIFSKSFLFLAIDMLLIGITAYAFLTSSYTWILSLCKNNEHEKFKALGLLSMISNLGGGLAAILIGFSELLSFKSLFLFSTIFLILSGISILFMKKIVIHSEELGSSEKENFDENSNSNNSKILYIALICILVIGSIVAQLNATYPLYVQDLFPQMGLKSVSILFIFNSFLIVFFQTPLVHFLKNINKLRLVGIGSSLLGTGMFVLIFSINYFVTIVACLIFTLGEMIFFSSVQLVCYQSGDSNKKGQSMGLFRIFYGTSRIIGPIVGGFLYHFNPYVLWILCGFMGIFCWLLCESTKKRLKKS